MMSHLDALTSETLIKIGVEPQESLRIISGVKQALKATNSNEPTHVWSHISQNILTRQHPFALHQLLYRLTYAECKQAPCWIPRPDTAAQTNAARFMATTTNSTFTNSPEWKASSTGNPLKDWNLLQTISFNNPESFWPPVLQALNIPIPSTSKILERHPTDPDQVKWLPGARYNIADCALSLNHDPSLPAIIWADEDSPTVLHTMTRQQLRHEALVVAEALLTSFGCASGDAVAVDMPMTSTSVVIYLGIVLAGCVVVSIADSFAASEIESRLRISKAKGIFTQDVVLRGGRELPLYTRVVEANAPRAIVVPAASPSSSSIERVQLRPGDVSYIDFLSSAASNKEASVYIADSPCDAITNILFSSGTTGEPKAIPWTHVTPIRCGADAFFHQDVRVGDVVCWPTSLGWMMGPWLVYASLLNGAAMALFGGSPLGRPFGEFITRAQVTVLGLVPSIVKAWRETNCMDHVDWSSSSLRCFSSTGEASAPEDYLWLSALGGYIPVIEYCGGTEIGGAYITGTMLQNACPSTFTTPSIGSCPVLLLVSSSDASTTTVQNLTSAAAGCSGEIALRVPMLGVSQRLLNRNHSQVYYEDMPEPFLRRHGDEIEALAGDGGYYRACGRIDDSMNLGGIKVSSVEIERALDGIEGIREVAAVSIPPAGGGPERLVLFIVPAGGGSDSLTMDVDELKTLAQKAVSGRLNPLFKVYRVVLKEALPRTASNKVMRRVLRDEMISSMLQQQQDKSSRL